MNLMTRYLGLTLAHPFMIGASPLCDDLDTVKRLEDAGSSAIGGSELGQLVPDGDRTGPLAEAPPAVGAHPMASHAPHVSHVSHVSDVERAGGNRGAWTPATNSGVQASEAASDITHATMPSCQPADRWHRPE